MLIDTRSSEATSDKVKSPRKFILSIIIIKSNSSLNVVDEFVGTGSILPVVEALQRSVVMHQRGCQDAEVEDLMRGPL